MPIEFDHGCYVSQMGLPQTKAQNLSVSLHPLPMNHMNLIFLKRGSSKEIVVDPVLIIRHEFRHQVVLHDIS